MSANNEDAEDLASSIWAELYGLADKTLKAIKEQLAYYSGTPGEEVCGLAA